MSALLTGCASTEAQPDAGSGTVSTGSGEPVAQADKNVQAVASFSLAYDENDGLDPLACTSEENKLLSQLCFERLFLLDENFEPQMELCASVQRNSAKSYTLTIRDGVKFHSGEQLKPSDVVYSLNNARLRDDSTYQEQLSCISSVKYSGSEIYIRLKTAKSEKALEALLDVPIFCKGSEDDEIPDGSGPYKIPIQTDQLVSRCHDGLLSERLFRVTDQNDVRYWRHCRHVLFIRRHPRTVHENICWRTHNRGIDRRFQGKHPEHSGWRFPARIHTIRRYDIRLERHPCI